MKISENKIKSLKSSHSACLPTINVAVIEIEKKQTKISSIESYMYSPATAPSTNQKNELCISNITNYKLF